MPPFATTTENSEYRELLRVCQDNVGIFDFQEACVARIIAEIGTGEQTMVDGGAHFGRHTQAMLAALGAGGKVYAVEPLPSMLKRLTALREADARLTIIPMALSDRTAQVSFNIVPNNPSYSGIRVAPTVAETDRVEIVVDTDRLDRLIPGDAPCRLIKLDLEGGEYQALRGAQELLVRTSPLLVFENNLLDTAALYGYDIAEFKRFLEALDYRLFDIAGTPITDAHWQNQRPYFNNFVASRRAEDHTWCEQRLPLLARHLLVRMTSAIASFNRLLGLLWKLHTERTPLILFGAGNRARAITGMARLPFDFAVDNDQAKWGSSINDIEIRDPDCLKSLLESPAKIVVISLLADEIVRQLTELGFDSARIINVNLD